MSLEPGTLFLLVLVVMAAILAIIYLAAKRQHDRMKQYGVRAAGVIVRNKVQWGRSITVRPVVRFETQEGRIIEELAKYGAAFALPRYPEGATITVLYDREEPSRFEIIAASRSYI